MFANIMPNIYPNFLGKIMETLSPSIIKLRDDFLTKFKNLNLDQITQKLKNLLDIEKDEFKRIVILASRIQIIRQKIEKINPLQVFNNSDTQQNLDKNIKKDQGQTDTKSIEKEVMWTRVIIEESTEVNGVRFPAGIQIDVTKEDSERLISSGKASLVWIIHSNFCDKYR